MLEKIARAPYWLVAILFVSLCPLVMHTQETVAARERKEEKPAQKPLQNVTGCLAERRRDGRILHHGRRRQDVGTSQQQRQA
jgi:hypothetical protein